MRVSTRSRRVLGAVGVVAVGVAAVLASCAPAGFDPQSLIESVRILASRSDQPYAKPGATVRSEVLAVDERPDAAGNEPMQVYWLPLLCINPPNDAYYGCFSGLKVSGSDAAAAPDAGGPPATLSGKISAWDGGLDAAVAAGGLGIGDGGGGSLGSLPTGVDLDAFLIKGSRVVFQLPGDIISSHPVVKGTPTPYGVAIAFNIACAGHIEAVAPVAGSLNPIQTVIGCFNAQHQQLNADNYVIGYTEVFAYTTLTNKNPVITAFDYQDASLPIDGGVTSGISMALCPDASTKCPNLMIGVDVPDASQEPDPQNPGPDGGPLGEQVWVDFYTTMGSLGDDAILLFDPTVGRVTPQTTSIQAPGTAQSGMLWAVVHDNRGGAAWVTVPAVAH